MRNSLSGIAVGLGFFFSTLSLANVNGSGSGTLGLSYDNEEFSHGARADYLLSATFFRQQLDWSVHGERNSSSERPAAISGHYYEFERSYFLSSLDHRLDFSNPYLHWTSNARYRHLSADGGTDFPVSWGANTGPSYQRWVRPDISVNAGVFAGRDFMNDRYSDSLSSQFAVGKRLTGRTQLNAEFERLCTSYSDDIYADQCGQFTSLMLQGDYLNLDYLARYGSSEFGGERVPVYDVSFNYHLNLSSTVTFDYAKRRINNQAQLTDEVNSQLETGSYVLTRGLRYRYEFARFKLQIQALDFRQVGGNSPTIDGKPFRQKRAMAYGAYQLAGSQCASCSLLLEYEYDEDSTRLRWYSTTAGVEIPLFGSWSYEFNLKQTVRNDEDPIDSVNLLLHYNGRSVSRNSKLMR